MNRICNLAYLSQYITVIKIMKVKKKANFRNRYNQVSRLTRYTIWESDNNNSKQHIQESQQDTFSNQVITNLQATDMTVKYGET